MARNGMTRHELTLKVLERKESLWGNGDRKYNAERSAKNLVYGSGDKEPSIALLKWAANASDAELVSAVSSGGDYGFLFYK